MISYSLKEKKSIANEYWGEPKPLRVRLQGTGPLELTESTLPGLPKLGADCMRGFLLEGVIYDAQSGVSLLPFPVFVMQDQVKVCWKTKEAVDNKTTYHGWSAELDLLYDAKKLKQKELRGFLNLLGEHLGIKGHRWIGPNGLFRVVFPRERKKVKGA
jgi:hypothetical protein